jgi:hypothetical protein
LPRMPGVCRIWVIESLARRLLEAQLRKDEAAVGNATTT